MREIRFVSLSGILGYGFPQESLERALREGVDFVGVDAGSTDPGPYYLGSGMGFVRPAQVRRDLELGLLGAVRNGIPLIVGTAGGSGAKPHVEQFLSILYELAAQHDLHFKLAVIWADVDPEAVVDALGEGRVRPCGPAPELTAERVLACSHIVGQMGTGPIIKALDLGAQVVVAGRACDTAVFAAPPIRAGFDPGLALHLGKIAECGALCADPASASDCVVGTMRGDHFTISTVNPRRRCTPDSVAAHSLYEQPDPDCFYEPEGKVDLTGCSFESVDQQTVRVSGSRLVHAAVPTIKLEGALLRGYRSITIAGIRDPQIIRNIDAFEAGVREVVSANRRGVPGGSDYELRFIRYGLDGVMGGLEREASAERPPHEVGLVIEAVAPAQELADAVVALARATALHQSFPGRKTTAGNLAFPFSPSDLQGGPVYEFVVYHLLETDNPDGLFRVELREV